VASGNEKSGGESMDHVMNTFLRQQYEEGMGLAEKSDLFQLIACGEFPPERYLARFFCKGLVRRGSEIEEWNDFAVGIWMPSDYLKKPNPFEVVSWVGPNIVFHPNVGRGPFRDAGQLAICVGAIPGGTPLVDLLYQCFEIITYANVTMSETDALNFEACRWARQNKHRFPIDTRPLTRVAVGMDLELEEIG